MTIKKYRLQKSLVGMLLVLVKVGDLRIQGYGQFIM